MIRALLLLLGLAACSPRVMPLMVGLEAAHPTAQHLRWYAEVEECLGLEGDVGAVRWWRVQEFSAPVDHWDGAFTPPHSVAIREARWSDEYIVRHESAHHILELAREASHWTHDHPGFEVCT